MATVVYHRPWGWNFDVKAEGYTKCPKCKVPVSHMEEMKVNNGVIFHVYCVHCKICNNRLTAGQLYVGDDEFFCRVHYQEECKHRGVCQPSQKSVS